jgi:hypothetical protein
VLLPNSRLRQLQNVLRSKPLPNKLLRVPPPSLLPPGKPLPNAPLSNTLRKRQLLTKLPRKKLPFRKLMPSVSLLSRPHRRPLLSALLSKLLLSNKRRNLGLPLRLIRSDQAQALPLNPICRLIGLRPTKKSRPAFRIPIRRNRFRRRRAEKRLRQRRCSRCRQNQLPANCPIAFSASPPLLVA